MIAVGHTLLQDIRYYDSETGKIVFFQKGKHKKLPDDLIENINGAENPDIYIQNKAREFINAITGKSNEDIKEPIGTENTPPATNGLAKKRPGRKAKK